jgi:formate hydrogenlyase subunit 4
MDTGSSFEGMGASREATFSSLVEPAFFIIISSVAYLTGYKSFSDIFYLLQKDNQWNQLIIALSVITLFIMMLVEGSRVPVDDPNTHLELTMIHEVMVLDNSGPDFAFILYAGAMKLVVIGSIIANLVVPFNLNPLYSFLIFVGILFILAVSIGLIESLMARLRMTHVPQFILTMTSISLLVLAFIVFGIGGLK